MSEELVKRLREETEWTNQKPYFHAHTKCLEAADTIEAQAAEIEQWRVDYDCAVMDVERLREAGTKLAGFADHDFGCLHYERNDSCDCGYTQAWKAWNDALGETE